MNLIINNLKNLGTKLRFSVALENKVPECQGATRKRWGHIKSDVADTCK